MKRKYYLRGIGVGILFATIVLFTAYSISGGKKMSDEEVIKRAEELGMVQAESVLDHLTKPANSTEDDTHEATADTTDSIPDTTLGKKKSDEAENKRTQTFYSVDFTSSESFQSAKTQWKSGPYLFESLSFKTETASFSKLLLKSTIRGPLANEFTRDKDQEVM